MKIFSSSFLHRSQRGVPKNTVGREATYRVAIGKVAVICPMTLQLMGLVRVQLVFGGHN